jgi:hypothetical protein
MTDTARMCLTCKHCEVSPPPAPCGWCNVGFTSWEPIEQPTIITLTEGDIMLSRNGQSNGVGSIVIQVSGDCTITID